MKRCAFLSMDASELEAFFVYDELLYAPMRERGWLVSTVSWRDQSVDWSQYDVVVVRSAWDYQQDPTGFFECLQRIDNAGVFLFNPLALMQWNLDKHYLADLEEKGVDIVPTCWFKGYNTAEVLQAFDALQSSMLVVKPTISANADDTHRITRESLAFCARQFSETFAGRDLMLQPFVPSIVQEGEYSLFFFGDQYSHCICKRPAQGDFRVQEEHGGQLSVFEPDEKMMAAAAKVMASLPNTSLYARVDLVRYQQRYCLMEVELIEPSLYFNMDESSPQRFVEAFVNAMDLRTAS